MVMCCSDGAVYSSGVFAGVESTATSLLWIARRASKRRTTVQVPNQYLQSKALYVSLIDQEIAVAPDKQHKVLTPTCICLPALVWAFHTAAVDFEER